ncbi:NTP transferase domain-containing protein [Candidatus Saccharibacteria bacterium]|nr:NTP transferase domain-containing protein [Candidatus Saccharibacteria bacterium]
MAKVKKAIITDAGFASRYLPITKTIPKAMIPIGAKPVMQLCVEECIEAGVEEIIIVATPNTKSREIYEDYFHSKAENVKALLEKQGKSERFAPVEEILSFPKITIIEQDPSLPYGNGSPIASAKQFVENEEAFFVLYSDDLVIGGNDLIALSKAYEENPNAKAVISTQETPEDTWCKYGMIALKENGTLSHIVEKPKTPDLSPSNMTTYGRYLLTPEVFKYLSQDYTGLDGELWTSDAITELAKVGDVVIAKRNGGKWLTTGDPKNYFLTHLEYVLENSDYADEVKQLVLNYKKEEK